ncbi:uncharacterized protein LOC120496346 [Passer montanus]|uniref:uncharacterized protein LOC120496346 n=1 Tax=Passer montanus TaxID=9160 RepID=UPI00196154FE|nr:uncharacterized protein LOC120496346 [Passer montanus]
MHREEPVPQGRAARGASRSSTEQRPSEQSWSVAGGGGSGAAAAGHGARRPGHGARRPGHGARRPGHGARRPGSSSLRVLQAGKEQRAGHSSLGKAVSSRIPSRTGAIGNAKCCLGERGGFTPHCHLLSHLPGVLGGKLSSALPRDVSGHHHLHMGSFLGTGEEGSRSSCPCTPSSQLSLHSKGFPVTPDHSGVLSRRRIPGSPSGCPGGVEQRGAGQFWAAAAGLEMAMAKHPPGIYSCFFPLLPLVKRFVPGSSQLCRAQSGRMVHETWVLVWGMWGTPLSPAGSISPCAAPAWAPGEAVLLWHREREGLANRIRSCGICQQPQALGITWCSSTCFVLWQALLEVIRAVLISHPHLGTVASAPVAAPS